MGVGSMSATVGNVAEYGEALVGDRSRPRPHSREAIERVVFEELALVSPTATLRTLTPESSLAGHGIDTARFLDIVTRIEGRYQMRFRDEWLHGIRTCADLVECVTVRMFDEADRAVETATRAEELLSRAHRDADRTASGTCAAGGGRQEACAGRKTDGRKPPARHGNGSRRRGSRPGLPGRPLARL